LKVGFSKEKYIEKEYEVNNLNILEYEVMEPVGMY
jgi:hypothetical protein